MPEARPERSPRLAARAAGRGRPRRKLRDASQLHDIFEVSSSTASRAFRGRAGVLARLRGQRQERTFHTRCTSRVARASRPGPLGPLSPAVGGAVTRFLLIHTSPPAARAARRVAGTMRLAGKREGGGAGAARSASKITFLQKGSLIISRGPRRGRRGSSDRAKSIYPRYDSAKPTCSGPSPRAARPRLDSATRWGRRPPPER